MATRTATGQAVMECAEASVASALSQASSGLGGATPRFGFLFASPPQDLPRALAEAAHLLPEVTLVGCSAAGEFTERGLTRNGVAVMLVAGGDVEFEVSTACRQREPERSGPRLAERFSRCADEASRRRLAFSTTFLLTDGLGPSMERVVAELRRHTRAFQPVIGAAAADGPRTIGTSRLAASPGTDGTDAAVALHLFGHARIGVGTDHDPRASGSGAAERAAVAARDALAGSSPAGVLIFDGVVREHGNDNAFAAEMAAVRRIFPGTPVAGFQSQGEIARFKGRMEGRHANTVVVAALPK